MKKLLDLLLIINGFILSIAGSGFILMYLWNAFVVRTSADQSLMFWYLPILVTGLIMLSGGLFLGVSGIKKFKSR